LAPLIGKAESADREFLARQAHREDVDARAAELPRHAQRAYAEPVCFAYPIPGDALGGGRNAIAPQRVRLYRFLCELMRQRAPALLLLGQTKIR